MERGIRVSGTDDSQRDSRESIRANHSQLTPIFARITRISDSRESPDSRDSRKSIRENHATKLRKLKTVKKRVLVREERTWAIAI